MPESTKKSIESGPAPGNSNEPARKSPPNFDEQGYPNFHEVNLPLANFPPGTLRAEIQVNGSFFILDRATLTRVIYRRKDLPHAK